MIQPESTGEKAELILMLHDATHAQMNRALSKIEGLGCVKGTPRLLRVENFSPSTIGAPSA
jgi:hypothetical protein